MRNEEGEPGGWAYFEDNNILRTGKPVLIGIAAFTNLLTPCWSPGSAQSRKNYVDQLLAAHEWNIYYTDRHSGKRVMGETGSIDYPHELKTAIALARHGYDVLFAPKCMFKRSEKKFDIFIAKEHILLKADLKYISSKNPDTIANRVRGGSFQASRVVVEITSDINKKDLISGLRSAAFRNDQLREVWLFYKGKLYILPASLIKSKRVSSAIK